MTDSDVNSDTVEARASRDLRLAEDHARQSPLLFLDPAGVADLLHYVVTGEVREYDSEEAERRTEALAALAERTNKITTSSFALVFERE